MLATVVVLGVVAALLVVDRPGPAASDRLDRVDRVDQDVASAAAPAVPTPLRVSARPAAGRRLVAAMQRGWDGRRRAFVADIADAPTGRRVAHDVWRAWRDLQVRNLRLRWMGAARVPKSAPAGAVAGIVEATWTQQRWRAPVTTDLGVVFTVTDPADAPAGRLLAFTASRRRPAAPMPVWAMGRLDVTANASAQLVGLPGRRLLERRQRASLPAFVQAARRRVAALLPSQPGPLLVVLPTRAGQFRALLGGGDMSDTRAESAAVTSTVGRQVRSDAAMQIVFNPAHLDRLRPAAVLVVITHEIAHAFTGVPAVPVPLWVVEGFAEFTALGAHDLPLRSVAQETRTHVRRASVPTALPTERDFAAGGGRTRRAYGMSWLAFRTIEDVAGTAATARFYRAVVRGEPVGVALREHASLSLDRLTARWRADLRRLARARG